MITDCFGAQQWDFSDTETIFVQRVFVLLKSVALIEAIIGPVCSDWTRRKSKLSRLLNLVRRLNPQIRWALLHMLPTTNNIDMED
jgi:hypothetical protein